MSTQGPEGTIDPDDTTPPSLGPSQYGTPTWSPHSVVCRWTFEPDETGVYRFDGLLSRPVSRAPAPVGYEWVTRVQVYADGIHQGPVDDDSSFWSEGIMVEVDDLGATWLVYVQGWYVNSATGAQLFVDCWNVARVSSSYKETVQLPDRDCLVVMSDSKGLNDGDVVIAGVGAHGYNGETWPFVLGLATRMFAGDFTWNRAFNTPISSPVGYQHALDIAWDEARRRIDASLPTKYYNTDPFDADWVGQPTDPDFGDGSGARTMAEEDVHNQLGFYLNWTTQASFLIPSNTSYHTFAQAFTFTYTLLIQMAGPLGDARPLTQLVTVPPGPWGGYGSVALQEYLTPTDLGQHHFAWEDAAGEPNGSVPELLELRFRPDETPATSFDLGTGGDRTLDDHCTALWVGSMPPYADTDDAPEWGPYITDGEVIRMSTRRFPKDWEGADPSAEVLAIYDGGDPGTNDQTEAGWSDLDVQARLDHRDELRVTFDDPSLDAFFYFWALPLEMWQSSAPDPSQDPETGGRRAHFRGDPRLSLKMRIRPAAFTVYYQPPLEPADPEYPNLAGTPAARAMFWPQ